MVVDWWIVRGRQPRITYLATIIGAIIAFGLVALAIWWSAFVFVSFELLIGLFIFALFGGSVAVRRGGSLLMSVWVIFAPVAAVTLLVPLVTNDLSVSLIQLIDVTGAAIYVGLATAVPGGLLAYTLGVRSRTGPWERSLGNHLPIHQEEISTIIASSWAGVVMLFTAGLSVHIVNLGITWSSLLLGGLVVAGFAGVRSENATESVVLGLVTGIGMGLSTTLGFSVNAVALVDIIAMSVLGAIVVGIPIGILGYLAGRAILADSGMQTPDSRQSGKIST